MIRPGDNSLPPAPHLYLGAGACVVGRKGLFRRGEGCVVRMQHRVFDIPACNGGWRQACYEVPGRCKPHIISRFCCVGPRGFVVGCARVVLCVRVKVYAVHPSPDIMLLVLEANGRGQGC